MLDDDVKKTVADRLEAMEGPVTLVFFTQEHECAFCRETRELLEEVAELSDRLTVEVHDFVRDAELAKDLGVDKIPATVIRGDGDAGSGDRGIRLYGVPAGFEFGTLIDDILMVSSGDSGLTAAGRRKLAELKVPVHLQVFVTPTCGFCPGAVRLAHQFAMESDLVTADMVEATEFPHLNQRYAVMGVPKTIVNERPGVEGLMEEGPFLEAILTALHDRRS